MFRVLYSVLVMISLSRFIYSEDALVLYGEQRRLVALSSIRKVSNESGKCFLACPPETTDYVYYNDNYSISKNSLFVKKLYILNLPKSEDEGDICDKKFIPSVLLYKPAKRYEIGYEIYIDLSKEKYLRNNILQQQTPSDYESAVALPRSPKKFLHDIKQLFHRDEIIFNWKPVLFLKFDIETANPIQIQFETKSYVFENNIDEQCDDFYVGKELYKDKDIEEFYSDKNQRKIFDDYLSAKDRENFCGGSDKCVVKRQLVPIWYFQLRARKIATCSPLNTIPVWNTIAQGSLAKVDKYLYAVMKFCGTGLRIITGTSGRLTYKGANPETVYLDSKQNRIPIPKWIYKILEYKSESNIYFIIVILIRNDPAPPNTDSEDEMVLRAFCDDLCPLFGWEALVNEDSRSGKIKCCPMSKTLMEKLGIVYSAKLNAILMLSNFPDWSIRHGGLNGVDMRRQVNKVMESLDKRPQ